MQLAAKASSTPCFGRLSTKLKLLTPQFSGKDQARTYTKEQVRAELHVSATTSIMSVSFTKKMKPSQFIRWILIYSSGKVLPFLDLDQMFFSCLTKKK